MVLILVPPIAQDPAFHNFSAQKKFLGIPHFWNVITNIPFLALGIMGLVKIYKHKTSGHASRPLQSIYSILHWTDTDCTRIWILSSRPIKLDPSLGQNGNYSFFYVVFCTSGGRIDFNQLKKDLFTITGKYEYTMNKKF